jgi:hypothetical protein
VGIIVVGGTPGALGGVGWSASSMTALAPALARQSSASQSDLPTPVAAPNTTTLMPWAALS